MLNVMTTFEKWIAQDIEIASIHACGGTPDGEKILKKAEFTCISDLQGSLPNSISSPPPRHPLNLCKNSHFNHLDGHEYHISETDKSSSKLDQFDERLLLQWKFEYLRNGISNSRNQLLRGSGGYSAYERREITLAPTGSQERQSFRRGRRLPRGRSYVRNGFVIDLDIAVGGVKALVCGSSIYKVAVNITPVTKARWRSICRDCAGSIDSLVELLQGRFSKGVMERVCLQKTGLFPSPDEIEFSCSCPDWAAMCKHVAAVLYGIGARLDKQPELLFQLHQVDQNELIANAGMEFPLTRARPNAERILDREDLSELFGLDLVRDATTNATLSGTREKPRNAETRAGEKNKKRSTRKKRECDPGAILTSWPPRL